MQVLSTMENLLLAPLYIPLHVLGACMQPPGVDKTPGAIFRVN